MKMRKNFVRTISFILCICCLVSTTSAFAAAKEIKSDKWHAATVLNETDNEDGSIYVTIQDENGIRKLVFYPVETTVASDAMLTASLNWTGWGSPRTVYSNATCEQNLQDLNLALLTAFLTCGFGFKQTIAAVFAPYIKDALLPDQRTVWLGRTTWLNDDYTAYRKQDTFYSDGHYDRVMYKEAIKEYIGGN